MIQEIKNPLSLLRKCLSWFGQQGYLQGAFWAVMICLVSVANDILMRFLGNTLPVAEITFFRFLFSMLTIIPLMLSRGTELFKTKHPGFHIFRSFAGVGAVTACCYSVNHMPLAENTSIMFSQPLFFLPLAVFFLKEHVDASRWIATIVGFVGLLIIVQPGAETFRMAALVPIAAAFLFAILDMMSKKMVATESTYSLLFYFALGTTVCAFVPALYYWQIPTWKDIGLLVLLGVGANLIQVCILKAFSATDASALMPFRYVEFLFAAFFAFLLFGEMPGHNTLFGAIFIVGGTFFISYHENKRSQKRVESCNL